ncbi:hypothetical protein ACA910_011430 [Epithemia clementina (nom. ined.)]
MTDTTSTHHAKEGASCTTNNHNAGAVVPLSPEHHEDEHYNKSHYRYSIKSILWRHINDNFLSSSENNSTGGGSGIFRALRRRSSLNSSSSSWSSNPQDCGNIDVASMMQQQQQQHQQQHHQLQLNLPKRVQFDDNPVTFICTLSPWTTKELKSVLIHFTPYSVIVVVAMRAILFAFRTL